MQKETKGHTIYLKAITARSLDLIDKISNEQEQLVVQNLIIDLSLDKELNIDAIKAFLPIAKMFKKAKKSFVIIASDINFTKVPASVNVVPTLVEAEDLIDMEEIERYLGF